jgi:hypothetical protein
MAETVKQDLPFDININGVQYSRGKDVEIQSDHQDAVTDIVKGHQDALDIQTTHRGAVPAVEDPTAATAQTPTRPLGDEHVRAPQTVVANVKTAETEKVNEPKASDENSSSTKSVDQSNASQAQASK